MSCVLRHPTAFTFVAVQNAHTLSTGGGRRSGVPARLVPPSLRPDGEQGLGQPLQTQPGQRRAHGEPHVTGARLTRRPGRAKHKLRLLQGAVQQTHLRHTDTGGGGALENAAS